MNKETKLRIYNITAKAALKFGSESWVLKKREEQCLEAAQMKFLRHLLGITKLNKEKNQCIREKMGAQNIVEEIKQFQRRWLQHVQRMDTNRIPNQALRYRPKGQRNIGWPKKRWRTNFILRIKEQETCPTLHEHDDEVDWHMKYSAHYSSFSISTHLCDDKACPFFFPFCVVFCVLFPHLASSPCPVVYSLS